MAEAATRSLKEAPRGAAEEGVALGAPRLALVELGDGLQRVHRLLELEQQRSELARRLRQSVGTPELQHPTLRRVLKSPECDDA